jgi:hypothetical protein
MRVPLGEPGILRRIEPRVHAGQNRKAPRRRQREPTLVAEGLRVGFVGGEDCSEDLTHELVRLPERTIAAPARPTPDRRFVPTPGSGSWSAKALVSSHHFHVCFVDEILTNIRQIIYVDA